MGLNDSDCRHITDKVKVDCSGDTKRKQTNPHLVAFPSPLSSIINGPCKVNDCVSEGGASRDSKGWKRRCRRGVKGSLKHVCRLHICGLQLLRDFFSGLSSTWLESQSVSFTPLCCTLWWALCTMSVVRA